MQVGYRADGTLAWMGPDGKEVNPDGSPIPNAETLTPLPPTVPYQPPATLIPPGTLGMPMPTPPAQSQQEAPPEPAPEPAPQTPPAPPDWEPGVLQSVGRGDWTIIGRYPETQDVSGRDENNNPIQIKQPTGNTVWTISDGRGHNQVMVVRGPSGDQAPQVTKPPPDLPVSATQGQPNEGDTRSTVQNGYQVQEKFLGGQWVVDPSVAPTPWDPKLQAQPKEGDTRTDVQGGYQIRQIFKGGSWVTDPTVPPVPYDPKLQGQPKEGDTRQDVQGGYQIRQIFKGGSWVTDPSYVPVPYDPKLMVQPKEGDTRTNVQNGYQVQEIYRGGQWVTDPSVRPAAWDPKLQSAPREGDTRQNVQSGYQVQERYSGGQWVIDPSVPPKRYTPLTPQTLSAPATEPSIVRTDEQGNLQTVRNPNYQATTPAQIAGEVARLQAQASQYRDQLSQQIRSGVLTQDQATQQFNQWWDSTIEPQRASLAAAQQTAATDVNLKLAAEQRLQAEQQRANLATAQQAGQNAVAAVQAQMPYMVGPGYGQAVNQIANAFSSGKMPGNIDLGSAVTFQLPDVAALAKQATDQALAHLSPTAAQNMNNATGPNTPNYAPGLPQQIANYDPTASLSRSQYQLGAVGGPTTTVAPDGTVRVQQAYQTPAPATIRPAAPASAYDWNALLARQAADVQLQQAQAAAMPPYSLT